MAYAQAAQRPIPGAVATLGVSDRVTFLRKTYAHLGGALIAFAVVTWAIMNFMTGLSWKLVTMGQFAWLGVFALFMVANVVAQKLAMSETSRGIQYVGLGIQVVSWALMFQPILWFVMIKFGNRADLLRGDQIQVALSASAASVILQATIITLAIFIGLTVTVFVTRKDFSFLRGVLSICTFAALGTIVASLLFGFTLGALFSGLIVLLMAGYILHQTSLVMSYFPPTAHVAAAMMLFATVATLFMHVLNIVASVRDR